MCPRPPYRQTTITNTTIVNTRFHICRKHPGKQIGAIILLAATHVVIVSEEIGYDCLISASWVAVGVGGVSAGVGAVDVLTGHEAGAAVRGGACDVVPGEAVCVACGGGAGVGDGEAALEEVAGFETGDVGVCVEGYGAVEADVVVTAIYVVGVAEDGLVVAAVVGRTRGGAADGLDGSGAGGGSGRWWRWCCRSGRVCAESGRGLGIFLVGIHISAVEIAIVVVDSCNTVLGVATIRRSKAHAYAARKRVAVFYAPRQTGVRIRCLKIVSRVVGSALDNVRFPIRVGIRRIWGRRAKISRTRGGGSRGGRHNWGCCRARWSWCCWPDWWWSN